MTIVMLMSTDADIVNTQLNAAWNPVTNRYTWAQVNPMNLNIINGATIVVIAHGNGTEIGNAAPGVVDINAETFLALVQGNMANNAVPARIYISSCGPGIAEFAANVRIAAQNNQIWHNTRIFGHSDPVSGPVPPANDIRWTQIF
ncbi:hypothetical protein GA0061070_10323 [Kosakonia oryziphila]|jgi:hypothetical protein|uniref:DUF4347 domain-containing protein n=2 Tax=Kosakonia oryziphila TaxID=1005667 RepID=A0A1C4F754_9ENTR|nr:hypothetical protein GA0061070_10323 [Kosakonia oryziphila]